jgi:hypothetical protein
MRSNLSRAPVRSSARSDLLERQFGRYCPRYQGAVRALAAQHLRVADLALSFPTLLFALAVPRSGLDPTCAIERAIEGAPLAKVAAAADMPLWLRKLPPEALSRPIAKLPDDKSFRQQISNHLPSRKVAPIWLQSVADIADLAHEAIAIWIAREIAREKRSATLDRLRLVGLWAWFSGQPDTFGYSLIRKPWTPAIKMASALSAAEDWRASIRLYLDLGRDPINELWLRPACISGYDFLPLTSASQIADEASAMRNCLRDYGYHVAHNRSRLWSMRKDGRRVATLSVGIRRGDPLPAVIQLKAAGNAEAPPGVWWAARQWLHMHDLLQVKTNCRDWGSVPLDRAIWISLWRPYWLAKHRIPQWLPLARSRAAIEAL